MLSRILYYYFNALYLEKKLKSIKQLQAHQQKKLAALAKKHLVHSPFYKPYVDIPFNKWPIINKSIMMHHFDDINTVQIQKERAFEVALKAEQTRDFAPMIDKYAVGLSSGTSGNRGLFITSPKERDAWAGMILAKAMPNGICSKERIAFFLRANNQLYSTLNKSKTIQFHFFDLVTDFEAHIKKLNEIKPTIISAPASVLIYLARNKHKLFINPKKIISVAEVLESHEAEILSEVFNCIVSQIYQCTEGLLAISDRASNTLLMNESFLIIEKEWLDETRFVPIITDLFRHSQPVIRYRLDDVLVENRGSTHIYTELKQIEGRLGDVCYGRRGDEIVPVFADSIRHVIASSGVDFEDYIISQNTLGEFSIQISPENEDSARIINHLNQFFINQKCEVPEWILLPYRKPDAALKRRRIRSCFKPY